MTTISVRPLSAEDWALYRAVRLAALADAPEAFGSTLKQEQAFTDDRWRERLTRRNQFVAQDGAEVCGLIGIVPVGPGLAELVSMWVRPDARGRRVGDHLVLEALRWTSDQGFPRVELWVAQGNDPAERLYARHGFQRTGLVQPVREGEPALEFAMARTEPVTAGQADSTVRHTPAPQAAADRQ
ncbi:GNAT family N-acetyltransferase [Streptomyces sp. RGM 3693]|uniref:GNAT family N-acetyltransferase n=1 Tax=Streptomyces sp. RGM 3693 TaxID=3413284 RepID=UPI003D29D17F